jgi:AcrR family transcriptional regulator
MASVKNPHPRKPAAERAKAPARPGTAPNGKRAAAAPTPSGRRPAAPPEPKPLSRERIVAGALAVIADTGLAGFSMRKLGERLGREAMSLYHHFPSKQHLLDALVEHAIASVDVPDPGPDPDRRLRACMYSYRAMARRWPALFPLVAVHRLNTPSGVRFIESILRLVRSVDPDPEHAARTFRALGYYLIGAGLEETAGYARGPSAAEPVSEAFIARECPLLMESARFFQEPHWDAIFDLGVDYLAEGARRDVEGRAGDGSSD